MKLRHLTLATAAILTLVLVGPAVLAEPSAPAPGSRAHPDGVKLQAAIGFSVAVVTVSGPDGLVAEKTFSGGDTLGFVARDGNGDMLPDGEYTYEIRFTLAADDEAELASEAAGDSGRESGATPSADVEPQTITTTGAFTIADGVVVYGGETGQDGDAGAQVVGDGAELNDAELEDVLHYDDVIITGSECVGFDCADGESFGFDTIILKEHNLRIYFNDTSYTASYPSNNWRISINDSSNGGASYFAVDDADDGTRPFGIEAGAPSNSLWIEDYGRVGFGTNTPVVELHVKDSDTPTLRLQQDSSGGWTAQTFDVGSNESNFFIRDATNGSKLPFRIQPNTPSSTLCLKSDGNVGFGTWSPAYDLEVENTNEDSVIAAQRTDGVTAAMTGGANYAEIGSLSNHDVKFVRNDIERARLTEDGLTVTGNGASSFVADAPTGQTGVLQASSDGVFVGSTSDDSVTFIVDDSPVATLDADGNLSLTGYLTEGQQGPGEAEDIPLDGDYDGDGNMDIILWRPSTGYWYIRTSSSGYTAGAEVQWGMEGDTPLCADVDNDGKEDLVIWRPSTETWHGLKSTNGYDRYNRFQYTYDPDALQAYAIDEEGNAAEIGDSAVVDELLAMIAAQDERIATLEQQNADLEARLAALEVLVTQPAQATRATR